MRCWDEWDLRWAQVMRVVKEGCCPLAREGVGIHCQMQH